MVSSSVSSGGLIIVSIISATSCWCCGCWSANLLSVSIRSVGFVARSLLSVGSIFVLCMWTTLAGVVGISPFSIYLISVECDRFMNWLATYLTGRLPYPFISAMILNNAWVSSIDRDSTSLFMALYASSSSGGRGIFFSLLLLGSRGCGGGGGGVACCCICRCASSPGACPSVVFGVVGACCIWVCCGIHHLVGGGLLISISAVAGSLIIMSGT